MNNRERAEWIRNDEGLYRWYQDVRGNMTNFIAANRPQIDAYIQHEQHKHDGNGGTHCHSGCPYYRR